MIRQIFCLYLFFSDLSIYTCILIFYCVKTAVIFVYIRAHKMCVFVQDGLYINIILIFLFAIFLIIDLKNFEINNYNNYKMTDAGFFKVNITSWLILKEDNF